MCDLTPVIEGPVKFRDGKKVRLKWYKIESVRMIRNVFILQWKARYACVTRLSPVAGKT